MNRYCPYDGNRLHKAGRGWSGSHRIQRWRCPQCGTVKLTGVDKQGNKLPMELYKK